MLKPHQIRNKAGGGGAPIRHPVAAICPKCGDPNAVAVLDGQDPHRYAVACPACGAFTWDAVESRVVAPTPEGR